MSAEVRSFAPSKLPPEWKLVPILDPAWAVPTGITRFPGSRPYYSTGSIVENVATPESHVNYDSKPARAGRQVLKGDVLQARMAGSNKAYLVSNDLDGALVSTGFFQLRVHRGQGIDPRWLYYAVQTPGFLLARDKLATGTTQVAINDENLRRISIPVAPFIEQRRIVDAIESSFARLDDAKRSLADASRSFARLRSTLLAKCCSSTERVSIEEVVELITDGEHQVPPRSPSGVPFVSARNVRDGRIVLGEMDYITPELHTKFTARLRVRAGDVLISCSGSVGRCAVVPSGLECSLNRSVAIVRPNVERVLPAYLAFCLRSPDGQRQVQILKKQTAQANLFQGAIRKITLTMVGLEEQQTRVELTSRLLSVIEAQQEMVHTTEARVERLRASILDLAFRGAL